MNNLLQLGLPQRSKAIKGQPTVLSSTVGPGAQLGLSWGRAQVLTYSEVLWTLEGENAKSFTYSPLPPLSQSLGVSGSLPWVTSLGAGQILRGQL